MSATNSKGKSRRHALLYPTDIWPNGVEIPITHPDIEVYPNMGMWASDTEPTATTDSWSVVIIPLKRCNGFYINSTRFEYTYYLDPTRHKYVTNACSQNQTSMPLPNAAPYLCITCRNATASNIFKGFTAYYRDRRPEQNQNFSSIPFILNTSNLDGNWSDFIYCHGAKTVNLTANLRGSMYWYGEDKNDLLSRGYGVEANTYKVPDGAYWCRFEGYRFYAMNSVRSCTLGFSLTFE